LDLAGLARGAALRRMIILGGARLVADFFAGFLALVFLVFAMVSGSPFSIAV
jgi:hypothetical protein